MFIYRYVFWGCCQQSKRKLFNNKFMDNVSGSILGWLVCCVIWFINPFRIFKAKFCLYIYICYNLRKSYWMRNNQNEGWKRNRNFLTLTKYNTCQQYDKGKPLLLRQHIVIYKALFFNVAQGRLNGTPNETRTHSCRVASQAC